MPPQDVPQQPVAERPQGAAEAQKPVEKPPEVQVREGAEKNAQTEVQSTRENGDVNTALTADQERTAAAIPSMSEGDMAKHGIVEVGGVHFQNGIALDGPNAGKSMGEHELNPALSDNGKTLNLDLAAAQGVEAQDLDNDGLPDVPKGPAPVPPEEAAADAAAAADGGKPAGGDAPPQPGQPPASAEQAALNAPPGSPKAGGDGQDGLAQTEDQLYKVDGLAEQAPQDPTKRRTSAEVNATQDQATPGGQNPATAAPTLNSASPRAGATATPDAPATPATAPTEVAAAVPRVTDSTAAPTDAAPEAQTPEARAERATKALETHFANSPHSEQVRKDLQEFNSRTDITPEQKAKALENLVSTANKEYIEGNGSRSNMSQENIDRAVAGGINDIAKPRNIDQGDNGTCNTTVIQEGVAGESPDRYTAALRETALHGTYTGEDGFKARIPSDLMTPHSEAQGAQNVDGKRNFSSQLLQGGMLNHYWQQRGQYYTDTDARGEQRYQFDASKNNPDAIRAGQNPFTTNWVGEGANVGANEVGNMGRNFGIQGQFVYAQRDWVQGPVDPSVRIVDSPADLAKAKEERKASTGSDWGIAVVHSGNSLFTGTEGLGGSGGGHVVSTYRNGDLSNQWGGQFDRKGVSDATLFAAMSTNPATRPSDGPGGRGTPAGKFDDSTLPQRFQQHRDENPRAHGNDIVRNTPEDTQKRNEKPEDQKEEKKDGKEGKADDGSEQLKQIQKAALEKQIGDLARRIAYAQGQIDRGMDQSSTMDLYNAMLAGINTELRGLGA